MVQKHIQYPFDFFVLLVIYIPRWLRTKSSDYTHANICLFILVHLANLHFDTTHKSFQVITYFYWFLSTFAKLFTSFQFHFRITYNYIRKAITIWTLNYIWKYTYNFERQQSLMLWKLIPKKIKKKIQIYSGIAYTDVTLRSYLPRYNTYITFSLTKQGRSQSVPQQ